MGEGDPGYGQIGGCAGALGALVDCAYPCSDPFDPACFAPTCDDVTPCAPEAAEVACEAQVGTFYEMHGIDPSDGPSQSPMVLCGEICQRREAGGCDIGFCGEACALAFGPGVSSECAAAYVAEAECVLELEDACDESPCSDLWSERVSVCGF